MWEYVWSGSQLTQMKKGSDTLHFTYDVSGTPTTVTHKTATGETTYYYVTNLQGDGIGREYISAQIEDLAYEGIGKFGSYYTRTVMRGYREY